MEKILERLKALGYTLVGFYDSEDTTRGYRCVVLGAMRMDGEVIYGVWWANPKTGVFNRCSSFATPHANAHHDALDEFCDRCHQLHP